MKLVIIFGPHAVGKMTVGQELAKITDLKLFHNHMTIDIVADLFENMPQERRRLTEMFRNEIFKSFASSNEYGMIFTCMWALERKDDWDYIDNLENMFKSNGAEVYYVELEADYDIRLQRNKTENRLLNKPSKRNIEKSEKEVSLTKFTPDKLLSFGISKDVSLEAASALKEPAIVTNSGHEKAENP